MSVRTIGILTIATLIGTPAFASDMITQAPSAAAAPCPQAVDGVNAKIAGLGGSFANDTVAGAMGSGSAPLACGWGVQIDGSGLSFDNRFLGSLAGHLFWRDPTIGLLGVYGSYTHWSELSGVTGYHVGPEAEWYTGRWTLRGVAGGEFGNTASGTIGSAVQTINIPTRFFDEVDLAYYAQDNWELYAGHRYFGGENALGLGTEWGIPLHNGMMAGLFAEGLVGQNNFHGVWGGVRIYFGQHDKTLIRRHREDDPTSWATGPTGAAGVGGTGSNTSTTTPPPCSPYPACLPTD